jgi:ABC-2 type transport system ATP-binding protein
MTQRGDTQHAATAGNALALEVRDVTVRRRSRTVLDRIGLDAGSGEVIAVLGPNGAGKTTLLEVLTGLLRPDEGVVSLRGKPITNFAERAANFAFLPDGGELPAELRVRIVVDHALGFRARSPDLVGELRAALALDALLDRSAGELSRGEHQRVALFCALAVERAVVVLDEPCSAFDPLRLRKVLAALRRVADSGATVVLTVHHPEDAVRIADRLLVLDDGRVIGWGTMDSLRAASGVSDGSMDDVFVALLTRGGGDAA